ncbi:MAG: hypothetical protein MUE50_19385, partial [Pirellulaceae bacterium]|nr:hypothetical protein [Pirellulaceae bacterium]
MSWLLFLDESGHDHKNMPYGYFSFLERQREHGLLVVDEVEKVADRKFVRQLEAYFMKTAPGRERTVWIVSSPFFVPRAIATGTCSRRMGFATYQIRMVL